MSAPVIFLDIDGVLNHWRLYAALESSAGHTAPVDWLDRDCIARLDALCDATGAEVVISSSWRLYSEEKGVTPGWRWAADVLREAGLRATVIDGTPDLSERRGPVWIGRDRWAEIDAWLRARGYDMPWVILDDLALTSVPESVAFRFVRTNIAVGLTDADVAAARVVLAQAPCEQPSPRYDAVYSDGTAHLDAIGRGDP